jgi:hypothetical protein
MYSNQQLGDLGLDVSAAGIGKQAGSMVASFAAKTGAMELATIMGFGSMAGPIGMVVGAVVSILMAIFGGGKKPKTPVFGLLALIPDADKEKITVSRMLDLLEKRMIDFGWGAHLPSQQEILRVGTFVANHINSQPIGALAITSGGLPLAHDDVAHINWEQVRAKTVGLALPFRKILEIVTNSEIKSAILASPLPYTSSSSYYFQMAGETPGKESPAGFAKSWWIRLGISQNYDAVKISGGKALGGSLEQGFKSIPKNINDIFISRAGIDVMNGIVTDKDKADKAFKPVSMIDSIGSIANFPASLLFLLVGIIVLSKRRQG